MGLLSAHRFGLHVGRWTGWIPRGGGGGAFEADPAERFARAYLAERHPMSRAELVLAVRGWLAHRDRAAGGGANDLFAWGDDLWQDQAERVVSRIEAGNASPCT